MLLFCFHLYFLAIWQYCQTLVINDIPAKDVFTALVINSYVEQSCKHYYRFGHRAPLPCQISRVQFLVVHT